MRSSLSSSSPLLSVCISVTILIVTILIAASSPPSHISSSSHSHSQSHWSLTLSVAAQNGTNNNNNNSTNSNSTNTNNNNTSTGSNNNNNNNANSNSEWPRVGGLPVLYPPPLPVDCTPLNDNCTGCTSRPGCGFCYESISPIEIGQSQQYLVGKCTPMVDNTKSCIGKRFFVPGQCAQPILRPGCTMRIDGSCQLDYKYDARTAKESKLKSASQFYIACMIICGLMFLWYGFLARKHGIPYYGKWDSEYDGELRIMFIVIFRMACIGCATAQVIIDKWSSVDRSAPQEGGLYFGLFGYWTSYSHHYLYGCGDTSTFRNPDADIQYCNVLRAATITIAFMQLFSILIIYCSACIYVALFCCDEENPKEGWDTTWWRLDFMCLLFNFFSILMWISCHTIINEAMVVPSDGGPHYSLVWDHSWRLCVCTTFCQLFVVGLQAWQINVTSEPSDWNTPEEWFLICCSEDYESPCARREREEDERKFAASKAAETEMAHVPVIQVGKFHPTSEQPEETNHFGTDVGSASGGTHAISHGPTAAYEERQEAERKKKADAEREEKETRDALRAVEEHEKKEHDAEDAAVKKKNAEVNANNIVTSSQHHYNAPHKNEKRRSSSRDGGGAVASSAAVADAPPAYSEADDAAAGLVPADERGMDDGTSGSGGIATPSAAEMTPEQHEAERQRLYAEIARLKAEAQHAHDHDHDGAASPSAVSPEAHSPYQAQYSPQQPQYGQLQAQPQPYGVQQPQYIQPVYIQQPQYVVAQPQQQPQYVQQQPYVMAPQQQQPLYGSAQPQPIMMAPVVGGQQPVYGYQPFVSSVQPQQQSPPSGAENHQASL